LLIQSLLIVKKMLMNNDLAMQPPASVVFFSSGIHKFVDSLDECLNEYRRYVEN